MVGGVESDYSVCPRPLLQFLQFFSLCQTDYVRLRQVTSGYIRLRQFMLEGRDVELDNNHGRLIVMKKFDNIKQL